jgi:hypothetical protein
MDKLENLILSSSNKVVEYWLKRVLALQGVNNKYDMDVM